MQEKPESQSEGPNPSNSGSAEQHQVAVAIDALKRSYEADQQHRSEQDRKSLKYARRTSWTAIVYTILTAILLGAGIYSALQAWRAVDAANRSAQAAADSIGAANRAAKAATRQAEIAEDTEHRQLRAYLYAGFSALTNLIGDKPPEVTVHVRHGGETPAYRVMVTSHMARLAYPFSGDITKVPTPTAVGRNMAFCFRECDLVMPLMFALLTGPEREEIQKGETKQLFVWGEATYADTFQVPHYLHFCVSFGGANITRNQYEYCEDYNDGN
jgi:hypothetical protein